MRRIKKGGYSIAVTAVTVLLAVVVCLFAQLLPENIKTVNVGTQGLYVLTDETKEVLENLNTDVDITIIAKPENIDVRIKKLLKVYEEHSGRLHVKTVDPVYQPTILEQFGSDSIVVQCAATGKHAEIAFAEVIRYNEYYQYYYGIQVESKFDGEGQLTSAINAVTSLEESVVYMLAGHGETALTGSVLDAVEKLHVSARDLNLLQSGGEVPEDCELLVVNAPTVDISQDELVGLLKYMQSGGKMVFLYDFTDGETPNLNMLLQRYGMTLLPGYLADYAQYYRSQYYVIPTVVPGAPYSGKIADANLQMMFIMPRAMEVAKDVRNGLTVTEILTTTSSAVLEPVEGLAEGEELVYSRYSLGAVAEDQDTVNGTTAKLIALPAVVIDAQTLASYSNLGNLDLFLSCITGNLDTTGVSIPAHDIELKYNNVQGGTVYSMIYIAVIPAVALAAGLIVWSKRRRK